jgi:TRAP-type C4-dicarboxylate transport system substrate-binding protein
MKKLTILLILTIISVSFSETINIKFASLAPKSSAQGKYIQKICKDIYFESGKAIRIKAFYGGTMGDEEEIAKKIRYQHLAGGAFTGNGLGYACPQARILDLPGLVNNTEELDHLYKTIEKDLDQYFKKQGYVLITLAETGFAYFFSKSKIDSIESIKKTKMWVWKGDQLADAMMVALDIPAKSINFTEVIPSLQTGLIDGFYCAPTPAVSLQWNNEISYMLDMPICNVSGGIVMSFPVWSKFSSEQQKLIKKVTKKYIAMLTEENRKSDKNTIALMKKSGIKILSSKEDPQTMSKTGLQLKKKLSGKLFPKELADKAFTIVSDYRKNKK